MGSGFHSPPRRKFSGHDPQPGSQSRPTGSQLRAFGRWLWLLQNACGTVVFGVGRASSRPRRPSFLVSGLCFALSDCRSNYPGYGTGRPPCSFDRRGEMTACSCGQPYEGVAAVLDAASARLEGLGRWEAGEIETALRQLPEQLGMGAGKVFQPVRVAVTGTSVSPPLFESLAALACVRRAAPVGAWVGPAGPAHLSRLPAQRGPRAPRAPDILR